MGNPKHFSLELPGRCLALVNGLWPHATQIYGGERPDLGSLTSTFLIAMSMAMINAPIERIESHIGGTGGYADDRPLSARAVDQFDRVIRRGALADAPFYEEGVWRFVRMNNPPFPNIANGIPHELVTQLNSDQAISDARAMPASQWKAVLRNAMAHGGIAYLDEDGRSTYDRLVKMYAFVSGSYDNRSLTGLNILRISEDDYRRFLTKWVKWLEAAKLAQRAAA